MKKKVLLLIPSLEFGGAQRSLTQLSLLLSEYQDVFLVVFNLDSGISFNYGGKIISLNIPGGKNFLSKMYYFLCRCYKVRKLKEKHGIDASISYMDGANLVNILSRGKEKVIISVRGSQLHDETIRGVIGFLRLRILIPFLYRFADKIVALNKGIERELITIASVPKDKIKVIYNYYEVSEIEEKAIEGLPPEVMSIFKNKVIITAGRLAPEKGYQYLIEVFAELKKRRDDCIHLVILGDGNFRASLILKARELGLKYYATWESTYASKTCHNESAVFFLGYQENPFKFLSRSSVFTLTSSSEGGPNILSEAMACGVPIVSVDCPSGPREKLYSEYTLASQINKAEYADFGILMPMLNNHLKRDSINEWVETLSMILDDTKLQKDYIIKGKKRIANFNKELVAKEWLNVIQN